MLVEDGRMAKPRDRQEWCGQLAVITCSRLITSSAAELDTAAFTRRGIEGGTTTR